MVSTQNRSQIIKHYGTFAERNKAVNRQNALMALIESDLLCVFSPYVFSGSVERQR